MTIPGSLSYAACHLQQEHKQACNDRKLFAGELEVGHSRTVWQANVNTQKVP